MPGAGTEAGPAPAKPSLALRGSVEPPPPTRLLQPRLDRVAVDAAVLQVELVRPVVHLVDRRARHQPERRRLASPAVLLARLGVGERGVRRDDRPGVLERLPLALLAEDLEDAHALRSRPRRHLRSFVSLRRAYDSCGAGRAGPSAPQLTTRRSVRVSVAPTTHAASSASRTHCSCSRKRRRKASRSCERGPWPGHDRLQLGPVGLGVLPDALVRRRRFGSGIVSPSSRICGT